MNITIGLEIGKKKEHSAICVTQVQQRGDYGRGNRHYLVRYLERLPIGMRLPDISKRLAKISAGAANKSGDNPELLVNVTGRGMPLVDHLDARLDRVHRVVSVYFNQGDRQSEEEIDNQKVFTHGKASLISSLQVALEEGSLHLPQTQDAEILASELLDYQINLPADANERQGSFRVGTRDELVMAVGMTVLHEPGLRCGISCYYGYGEEHSFKLPPGYFG